MLLYETATDFEKYLCADNEKATLSDTFYAIQGQQ